MSEMVERVATAICAYLGEEEECIKFYRGAARAAIEAMREPTATMVDLEELPYSPGEMTGYWHAMIDAALGKVDA